MSSHAGLFIHYILEIPLWRCWRENIPLWTYAHLVLRPKQLTFEQLIDLPTSPQITLNAIHVLLYAQINYSNNNNNNGGLTSILIRIRVRIKVQIKVTIPSHGHICLSQVVWFYELLGIFSTYLATSGKILQIQSLLLTVTVSGHSKSVTVSNVSL